MESEPDPLHYHTLKPPVTYAPLKSVLEERLGLSHAEKCQIKTRFYAAKQLPGKIFKQYIGHMKQMAHQIDILESKVFEVSMSGIRVERCGSPH